MGGHLPPNSVVGLSWSGRNIRIRQERGIPQM